MRCALLPPKIPFGECWQAEYPRWPIRSHRSVAAHSSPLPTVQGFLARLDKLAFDIPDSAVKSLKDNLSLWLGLSKLAATEIGPHNDQARKWSTDAVVLLYLRAA